MFVYLKLYIYLILWTIPLIWKQLHKFDIDSNIRQNSNSKCYISTNIASAMAHIVNKHITLGINVEQITRYNQKKLPHYLIWIYFFVYLRLNLHETFNLSQFFATRPLQRYKAFAANTFQTVYSPYLCTS